MADIYSDIKGIKQNIKDKYPNIPEGVDTSSIDSKSAGWKQLLGTAKNNSLQYDHINLDTKSKYFNLNTHFLENIVASNTANNYRVCNKCGKPVSLEALIDHLNNYCVVDKTEKDNIDFGDLENNNVEMDNLSNTENDSMFQDDMDDDNKSSLSDIEASTPDQALSPSKRQKLGGSKKQRKVKQRNPTDKHLIDFDKQCGVELPEGGYCARSLTCKSHSMGAKRSVLGRTESYDVLLANYHRLHQTKIGAAAEKRAKQQEIQKHQKEIQKDQKRSTQKKPRGKNSSTRKSSNKANQNAGTDTGIDNIILSPEEETTQVLNGVSRSYPLPLESNVLYSVRRRTKYFRMREMFASSFTVKQGYSSPGYGSIHSRVGCIDIDKSNEYKFRIRTPQPTNMLQQQNISQQQRQRAQQQRVLHTQMMQQQQQQHLLQSHSQAPANLQSIGNVNFSSAMRDSQGQLQEKGLTPQEIQFQQQKLRQQQLQQQRFEAAAYHLTNNSKFSGNPTIDNTTPSIINQ